MQPPGTTARTAGSTDTLITALNPGEVDGRSGRARPTLELPGAGQLLTSSTATSGAREPVAPYTTTTPWRPPAHAPSPSTGEQAPNPVNLTMPFPESHKTEARTVVSVVVDATPVSSPAGPRSRDLCGGLAICLVVIVAALAVIVLLRPAQPKIVTLMLGCPIFSG